MRNCFRTNFNGGERRDNSPGAKQPKANLLVDLFRGCVLIAD